MILNLFTLFHVLLSLAGIGSGFVVIYAMLQSRRSATWTNLFLATTIATSVTGFLFPFHGFLPAHTLGIISLVVLGVAIYALRSGWNRTFVISSVLAQYLNVFVLVVQMFEKTPALKQLAPTQTEVSFEATQLAVLLLFVGLGFLAAKRS